MNMTSPKKEFYHPINLLVHSSNVRNKILKYYKFQRFLYNWRCLQTTDEVNIQSSKDTNYVFALLIMLAVSFSISILVFTPSLLQKTYGHAFVINSDPSPSQLLKTPPSSIQVSLSEPVDERYSKISVLDSTGKQVDRKDVHYVKGDHTLLSVSLPASVKDGVYTVSTKMLSEVDGHVTDNAFVFGVGKTIIPVTSTGSVNRAESQLSVPDALARFPSLVGQVIIVGGAFLALWIWKPITRIDWLFKSFTRTKYRIDRSFYVLMLVGSFILIFSDIAMISVQASSINATIGEAISTKFGSVWIVRTILSLALASISILCCYKQGILRLTIKNIGNKNKTRESSIFSVRLSRKVVTSFMILGTLTLFTTSLISHGAAVSGNAFTSIIIDFIHNFGASLWIGGLIYLAFVIAPSIKKANLDENVKASILSIILPRFSTIPVTILGLIVITGPFLLYILESNLALTLASFYGKVLIVKLSLAAVMIVIGGYNQARIYPQALKESTIIPIKATLDGSSRKIGENKRTFKRYFSTDTDSRKKLTPPMENENSTGKAEYFNTSSLATTTAISKFNKTTKIEALIGIALLLAVAVMVNSGLPESEFQSLIQQQKQQYQNGQSLLAQTDNKPFTSTSFTEDGDIIILSIDPFTPGSNNFQIKFLNSTWIPIDISSAKMRLTQTEKGIGPIEVDTRRMSPATNEFSTSASFGLPGKWEIQIEGTPKKENAPNIIGTFDLLVKPPLDQTKFNVHEFHVPSNMNTNSSASQPLYPVYDRSRNVIWVGDTSIGSGRLLAFNLSSGKYYSHKLDGTSIVTSIALDSNHNNDIWYIDPLNKNLGNYDPNTNTNTLYRIKSEGPPSGVTIANSVNNSTFSNIWISLPADNEILRFNTQTKNFTNYRIPTPNSGALGIAADNDGLIWFAEAGSGKLGSIDTNKNFKITEYPSSGERINNNSSLKSPTALLIDPDTDNIYISEHDGHTVSVFDPLLKTFKRYPDLNPKGLPFGMALDGYHNLWVAEHIINKISVIDTTTGEHKDINIPTKNPFTQWLTADTNGNIWFAEQRGNSLGTVSAAAGPLQASSSSSQVTSPNNTGSLSSYKNNAIPQLGVSYAEVVGPAVAAGIIFSAVFYARSILDLKKSMNQLTSIDNTEINKKKP